MSLKSAHKSVRQRCLIRSAFEELWTRVPHQNAALKTSKSVWPKCNYITNMIRIPAQKCQTTAVFKEVPGTRVSWQECLIWVSHESVLQECLKKRVSKRVSQRCLWLSLLSLFGAFLPTSLPSELSQDARKCMGFLLPGYALPYDCPVKEGLVAW